MNATPALPDLVIVVVNTPQDLRAKAAYYRRNGYRLRRAARFDKITVDLQDFNGQVVNLSGFAVFTCVRRKD